MDAFSSAKFRNEVYSDINSSLSCYLYLTSQKMVFCTALFLNCLKGANRVPGVHAFQANTAILIFICVRVQALAFQR